MSGECEKCSEHCLDCQCNIDLFGGIDPPADQLPEPKLINYKESDRLDCIKCGKKSSLVIEDTKTGEWDPLNICKNCMFVGTYYPLTGLILLAAEDLKQLGS